MIPSHLLPNLSLPASKLYLVFLSLQSPEPTIQVPIATLVQLSSLAPRTCRRALKELRDLKLLHLLPRRFHASRIYELPFAPQTKGPAQASDSPPKGPLQAPYSLYTPTSAIENPMRPPQAPLLNTSPASAPTDADELAELTKLEVTLRLLKSQLLFSRP